MLSIKAKISLTALLVSAVMMAGALPVWAKESDNKALMRKIRGHIEQNMIWPADSMRMEFLSPMPKTDDLSGKITYRIESRFREEYIGDTSFNVRIFAGGIFAREENVRVRIEVQRDFVVSIKGISKGSILQESNVTVQKKWVRSLPQNTVSSLEDAVGKCLIVSIRPNTRITRVMLKEVMPVRKGKMVRVILDGGAMKMMMNGVAEQDGAEDDLIRVRNISSNKIIYARVIGQGRVQVDF